MSRFDLHHGHGSIDYYLNVQSEFHDHLATRVVIPVLATRKVNNPTRGVHVSLTIDDAAYYLVTPMIAALPAHSLGRAVGNLADQSHGITSAIDFLFQGF